MWGHFARSAGESETAIAQGLRRLQTEHLKSAFLL